MPSTNKKKIEETKVVCFNCGALVNKKDAFYIVEYDTYLDEKCYLKMLNGESVKLNNWHRSGV